MMLWASVLNFDMKVFFSVARYTKSATLLSLFHHCVKPSIHALHIGFFACSS